MQTDKLHCMTFKFNAWLHQGTSDNDKDKPVVTVLLCVQILIKLDYYLP